MHVFPRVSIQSCPGLKHDQRNACANYPMHAIKSIMLHNCTRPAMTNVMLSMVMLITSNMLKTMLWTSIRQRSSNKKHETITGRRLYRQRHGTSINMESSQQTLRQDSSSDPVFQCILQNPSERKKQAGIP